MGHKSLTKLGEPKWAQWVQGDEGDPHRLWTSGDQQAREVLLEALASQDEARAYWEVFEAVGKPGDDTAVPVLARLLFEEEEHGSRGVFAAACGALVRIATPAALAVLARAQASHSEELRDFANHFVKTMKTCAWKSPRRRKGLSARVASIVSKRRISFDSKRGPMMVLEQYIAGESLEDREKRKEKEAIAARDREISAHARALETLVRSPAWVEAALEGCAMVPPDEQLAELIRSSR